MKAKKLFELLTLVNGVNSTRWETVKQLVEEIAKGTVTIKSKKWNDEWKQKKPEYYPLDLAKIDTWSAFDDTCIDLQFSNEETKKDSLPIKNKLVCKAKIYEGESFGGYRTGLKFEALLLLPNSFINNLERRIEWKFDSFLEDAYENHLKAQKELWVKNLKYEILNK